jgi:hypothetical protein
MTNREKKIVSLLEEGFSYDTIKKMNDYHLNRVYESISIEDSEKLNSNLRGAAMAAKELGSALKDLEESDEEINEDEVLEALFGKPKKKMKTPITTLGMFEENDEYAICMDSIQGKYGPKKDWNKIAQEKFDACVTKVGKETKEEKVRQIEESIVSLIKKSQGKVITKSDILQEDEPRTVPKTPTIKPGTKPERGTPYQPKHSPKPKAGTEVKPARPTVKPGVKPERGTPYQPKHSPKPKAGTEVKPARPTVKPGVKPERGTPYQPKHSPKPKAGNEGGLPEFLKFNNLNIKFRDE